MEKINYCKTVDCMSRCTLTDIKEQHKCKFFAEASRSALNPKQCRYYRPDINDHCDNVKAQMNTTKPKSVEEKLKVDLSY